MNKEIANAEKAISAAIKKADFKKYLIAYAIVNLLLWIIWWFAEGDNKEAQSSPWPLWIMLGWGLGMVFKFIDAYTGHKSLPDNTVTPEVKNETAE
jgi:fucose permease